MTRAMARSIWVRSVRSSDIGGSFLGLNWGAAVIESGHADHKGVLWLPGETDRVPIGQRLGGAPGLEVLRVDGQPVTVAGLDEVLRADANVARVEDRPVQGIEVALRPGRPGAFLPPRGPQLF